MSLLTKRGDAFPSVFNNLFDDFFKDDLMVPSFLGSTVPAVNVSEEKDHFEIEVAAPGMKKDDFALNLDYNVLTISCEKKKEEEKKEKQYTRKEFSFSSFRRSFTLPESVNPEKIDAAYKDGVLKIILLKKPGTQKLAPREIKIV